MLRILDAANTLFGRHGFDDAQVEAIAELAEVSPGTVYNYFGGKNEILLTLAAIENERLLDLGGAFEADPDATVADAVNGLFGIYYGSDYMMLHRELWRLGFLHAFANVSTEYSQRLRNSDHALRQQVVEMIRFMQWQGRLRSNLDCEVFGATLFNNANMLFLEFTWSESSTFEGLLKEIKRMTNALVELALPAGAPNNASS